VRVAQTGVVFSGGAMIVVIRIPVKIQAVMRLPVRTPNLAGRGNTVQPKHCVQMCLAAPLEIPQQF